MSALERSGAEGAVRRYYAIVGDTASTAEDLRSVLAPDFELSEHPNALSPRGSTRDLSVTITSFEAGKGILTSQNYDLRSVLVEGDRVEIQGVWTGTLAREIGSLAAGTTLRANISSFLTVRDGLIAAQETYDCYDPFGA